MSDKVTYSTPISRSAMAYVLAGGRGLALMELTDRRAKPAVYFGGKSRIIDFALSNALNSGIRRIARGDAVQGAQLIRHLQRGWNFLRRSATRASTSCRPRSASRGQMVQGTADAVFQNIDIIDATAPSTSSSSPATTSTRWTTSGCCSSTSTPAPTSPSAASRCRAMEATGFGVMHVDADDRIVDFFEKPPSPPEMPDKPDWRWPRWASTSSSATFLNEQLRARRRRPGLVARLRQGHHPLPREARQGRRAPLHQSSCVRSRREAEVYWRDVGTIDAYWEANIDLTDVVPALDIFDNNWPIWTYGEITPPAKFVHDLDGRRGEAISALVSGGCIVSGAVVRRSLLFTGVQVHSFANVENGVILPYVDIARGARLKNVVVDHGVRIPEGLIVGEDPVLDAARFRRSAGGVCLITQPMIDQLGA
jgi:glucose-1-phosphate adenylyltransferase